MKKHNKPKKSKSQLISFKFGRIDYPFERIIFATKNKAIADSGQPMANLRNVSKEDFINRRAWRDSNPRPLRPKRSALNPLSYRRNVFIISEFAQTLKV